MSNYGDSAYDENNPNNSWYKALHMIPAKSLVLDVGCSSGHFGQVLIKEKQCVVDGIELDPEDAATAKKLLRTVKILNIETDSIEDITERYDVVYFGDVIEHLVNPVASLKKVKSLLKPKGRVIFSVPNMAHVTVRLLLLKGTFEYTNTGLLDKTHLHFYTLEEIQKIFKEAGYIIEKMDFVEKDYPNELLDEYISKVGLQASSKFYELMHHPDAAAFQFVGSAMPGATGKVERAEFGPIDFFETYYTNTVGPLRQKVEVLQVEVSKLTAKNAELEERFSNFAHHPVKAVAKSLSRKVHHKPKA
jgi:2-polyprenyl-3-methyl-5-hydroxy-6-metoxy-1,4-benzoquinol methylase